MRFETVEFRAFDYDGFKTSLFQLAAAEFTQWTDTLESNQGVMFVEWLAYLGANIAYMQNFQARQCFVATVTEATSLANLAKAYDYQIPNNIAAEVVVTFAMESGTAPADIIIPALTQIRTAGTESLIFETLDAVTLPSGATEVTATARHQETKIETAVGDGSADFSTRMTYGPYIHESMAVTVNNVAWAQVDNFLDSNNTAEHFRVEVDSDGIASVVFGDGVSGKLIPEDADVQFTYLVGGGTAGNIPPEILTVLDGTFYDVNGDPVDLTVINEAAATGGEDREDLETTKLQLPASLSAKEVTLNYDDFETNIGAVPGVARVQVQTVNDNPAIPENTTLAIVLPTASDTISPTLETSILAALEENPTTMTHALELVNPSFVTIAIDVRDLVIEDEFDDDSGDVASATVTLINNTFNAGDAVTVNGVTFTQSVDWTPGGSLSLSATALAAAIEASGNAALQDITAEADGAVVTLSARTRGVHGNSYTLTETDGVTNNMTLSGSTFSGGEDTTVQAAVRSAIEAYFGRTNQDENNEYTVAFGATVYRNDLIWLVRDVEIDGVKPVVAFTLQTPATDTALTLGEFPKYTLQFTTSA